MKQLFIIFTLSLLPSCLFAQIVISPEMGINISNYKLKQEFISFNTQAKGSLCGGVNLNMFLRSNLALESGLFYKMNGYKRASYGYEENATIHSLEIPVCVLFTPDTRKKKITVGAGIYGAYYFKGNVYVNGVKIDMRFGESSTSSQFFISKPIDFGCRMVSIVTLSEKIYFKSFLQVGLRNLYAESSAPDSRFDVKNYNYGVILGYKIERNNIAKNK